MRIVFYNSNSNYFDPKIVHIKTLPSWAETWASVKSQFPEHEFFIATMLPSMFLMDYENDSVKQADGIHYTNLKGGGAVQIADEILALRPDVAIAASFWITPYDWLALQDAMVADILRARGVTAICHPVQTEAICFDKNKTHIFLEQNNFNCAKGIYVDYDLFWCTRKKPEVRDNVYREYILSEISRLNFPVIIKDTTGLSSYGMEVLPTIGSVRSYLESKKFNSGRMVEEFLDGIQFGTEIHSVRNTDGSFTHIAFPPLMYSVNQYGITSPKQSVKLGPLTSGRFKTRELQKELERLADLLHFEGSAQVDLVFHNEEWFIIEINPRMSGSSAAIALIKQKSLPRILTELALGIQSQKPMEAPPPLYLNIKFPNLNAAQMRALYDLPFVKYLCQTDNDAAKQRREMGFCEILFGGAPMPCVLESQLDEIKEKFPEIVEPSFYKTAKEMLAMIK